MNYCFSCIYRIFILFFFLLDNDVRERQNVVYFLTVNVVVPSESKLTVATCDWTRAITQIQTTRDGVNGGTLPCVG